MRNLANWYFIKMSDEKNLKLSELKQDSIEVKKNAKGDYAWDIKVYFNSEETKAIAKIESIDKKLKEIFQ